MFRWLVRFGRRRRQAPDRATLLNEGLELAMDWGQDWLAPIQDRMLQRHRSLQADELDAINADCQAAMRFGHETAYALVRDKGTAASQEEFVSQILARHGWVSADNAARLFRQSMYYAWKTGGPPRGA